MDYDELGLRKNGEGGWSSSGSNNGGKPEIRKAFVKMGIKKGREDDLYPMPSLFPDVYVFFLPFSLFTLLIFYIFLTSFLIINFYLIILFSLFKPDILQF